MNTSLGGLPLSIPLLSAPLAELTEAPFHRLLSRIGGCGLFYSAMLSVPRSRVYRALKFSPEPGLPGAPPMCLQILASTPDEAIEILDNAFHVFRPAAVDVNMGCAAPRIRRIGAGATLMRRPETARAIVSAVRSRWDGPLLAKIRAGDETTDYDLLGFCRGLEEAGLDALVFHGRFIREKFTRVARWAPIAPLAGHLSIPIIGNGDIRTAAEAVSRLNHPGCRAVMIGRAALGNPWIFSEAHALLRNATWEPPSEETIAAALVALLDDIAATFDPGRAVTRVRKIFPYLLSRYAFGRQAAVSISRSNTTCDQRRALCNFFEKTL